jgi:hypothetical protein
MSRSYKSFSPCASIGVLRHCFTFLHEVVPLTFCMLHGSNVFVSHPLSGQSSYCLVSNLLCLTEGRLDSECLCPLLVFVVCSRFVVWLLDGCTVHILFPLLVACRPRGDETRLVTTKANNVEYKWLYM